MVHGIERKDIGFTEPQKAFEHAIKMGRLNTVEGSDIFAGGFMYMGDEDGHHLFKKRCTREYIFVRMA